MTFPAGIAVKGFARFGESRGVVMIDALDDRFKSGAYNFGASAYGSKRPVCALFVLDSDPVGATGRSPPTLGVTAICAYRAYNRKSADTAQ